jgi:hypothetical protein
MHVVYDMGCQILPTGPMDVLPDFLFPEEEEEVNAGNVAGG